MYMFNNHSTDDAQQKHNSLVGMIPVDEPYIILRASQIGSYEALMSLLSPTIDTLANKGMHDRDTMAIVYQVKEVAQFFKDWQNRNLDKLNAY